MGDGMSCLTTKTGIRIRESTLQVDGDIHLPAEPSEENRVVNVDHSSTLGCSWNLSASSWAGVGL
jgi:hypothetical protein